MNSIYSCLGSDYHRTWKKVRITDRRQSWEKNEAKAEKTILNGLAALTSALCSSLFAESDSVGLAHSQSLLMEKSKDY